jgi:hypothetical protein
MRAAAGILLLVAIVVGATVSAGAAELRIVHRHTSWRIWPQQCFLMPDVIVAVDALGPYCYSPRGHYHRIARRW